MTRGKIEREHYQIAVEYFISLAAVYECREVRAMRSAIPARLRNRYDFAFRFALAIQALNERYGEQLIH